MKLCDKIQMVNDMILENPDSTIADYLYVLMEVESITPGRQMPKKTKPAKEITNDFIKSVEEEILSGRLVFKTTNK